MQSPTLTSRRATVNLGVYSGIGKMKADGKFKTVGNSNSVPRRLICAFGRRRPWQAWLLAVILAIFFVGTLEACPTCKDGIAEGGNSGDLVSGYGWSIVFMMSMPFLIFAGLGSYFYYEICRARREHASLEQPVMDAVGQ